MGTAGAATGWAEWMLAAGGWALLAVGGMLLLWALFGDRSRGRKRCPKCWYDMSGAVARQEEDGRGVFTCPECGRRVTGGERGLRRTRRRWGWGVAALMPFIASFVLLVQYRVSDEGWGAYVPSWPLVLGSRWFIVDEIDPYVRGWGPLAHTRSRTKDELFELLHGRAERNDLSRWQWAALVRLGLGTDHGRLLATRYSGGRPYGLVPIFEAGLRHDVLSATLRQRIESMAGVVIRTRDAWPRGVPVYAEIKVYHFQSKQGELALVAEFTPRTAGGRAFTYREPGDFSTGFGQPNEPLEFRSRQVELGVADGRGRLEFDVKITGGSGVGEYRATVPVRPLESAAEVLTPVQMEKWESRSNRPGLMTRAVIAQRSAGPRLELRFDTSLVPRFDYPTIALEAEVYRDGVLMYRGQNWASESLSMRPGMPPSSVFIAMVPVDRIVIPGGVWTVRLRGDAIVALRDFSSSRYWAVSEFELPLEVHERR